jgi:alpha-L-arabinofuranosidase
MTSLLQAYGGAIPGFWRRHGLAMFLAVATTSGFGGQPQAATPILRVQTDRPGARINPAMWGLFFEDINFGADGGLYAELVKNRSFEFPDSLMGWKNLCPGSATPGNVEIREDAPLNEVNSHYARVTAGEGSVSGLVNEGFRGMGIRGGKVYEFSAWVRSAGGSPALALELVSGDGRVLAGTRLKGFSADWRQHFARLRPKETDAKAQLRVMVQGPGALDLDMVSLFPRDTWKGRRGGLRADLVEMLAAMKPGFLRFPGGCIVEGRYLTNRYDWKRTIGAPETRRLIMNRWNNEFRHRPAPDYCQSFGLGFFEYFQLCEDLGAEPMPILNCGMACQFNSGELAPLEELDSYIQDALDLIEFANGPASSRWGSQRAAMGHQAPFGMKLLGIGNEQWGPQYIERYARFAKVLKERHPEIQLISSAGPAPADDRFTFAWGKLRELRADIIDEHCYAAPKWFFDNIRRYDDYDRQGPKVFMGEYAAQSVAIASPDNRNTIECALAEAAYMTGMERNADVVRMASYAPLFGHADAWQWTPNLIWCDNLRVYGTPNYYVQSLFSRNRGDVVLPLELSGDPASGGQPDGRAPRLFASAVKDERSHEVILKVVNPSDQAVPAKIVLAGCGKAGPVVQAQVLSGGNLNEQNSFENPRRIAPVLHQQRITGPVFEQVLPPYSFIVLRVRAR